MLLSQSGFARLTTRIDEHSFSQFSNSVNSDNAIWLFILLIP